MAKKKVAAVVKIQIPAGQATPAPPVGTALGPHGVAIMDFCKAYNAATESQRGTIVPVEITIFEDRSFTFVLKTPPTAVLLRQAAGLEKGSPDARARRRPARSPTPRSTEIAKTKMPDLNANDLEAAKLQVAGTARSMGVTGRRLATPTRPPPGGPRLRQPGPPREPRSTPWRSTARSTPTRPAGSTATTCTPRPRRSSWPSSLAPAKFDETVELAVRLGVDPRKADQIVRGTVALPAGTGKDVRVAVFAAGDAAAEARAAGADHRRRRRPRRPGRGRACSTSTSPSPRPT